MLPLSIADALFTKTQQRVYSLLFGKPDRSFYTNEIMRWADMGRGTVQRELDRLVAAGLLVTFRQGNQQHYRANTESPVYQELLSIVRKTFGVADVIREALEPLDSSIQLAFVYGSMAKATESQESDLDLMLVGDGLVYADVVKLLMPVETSLNRTINPTIYTEADFQEKIASHNSFVVRVMEQPKLMIKGVIDDVGEPGQDRLAEN